MQLDVSTSDEEKLIYVKKHGRAFTARAQGKQGFHRGDAEARRKSRKDWPRNKSESLESQQFGKHWMTKLTTEARRKTKTICHR